MGFGVVDVKRFGGLQLSTDPGDVGLEAALAGQNFEIAHDRSFARARDGMSRLGSAGALSGSQCLRLLPDSGSVNLLAIMNNAGTTTYLDRVTPGGVVTAVGNWTTVVGINYAEAVNFGTPAAAMTFIASEGTLMRKYTGGALSASVGKPRYLSVMPTSNRLVQGYFAAAADSPTGALGSTSTLFFSDAGAPETFSANNYVHLRPGDGESIRGIVQHNGQMFVFKDSTLFVFSGESLSSTGTPIFDYRAVNLGVRVTPPIIRPVVAVTSRGAYYVGMDGVYLTSGGTPRLVSAPLTDLFRTGAITTPDIGLWAVGNRVLLVAGVDPNYYAYVLDERHGEWSKWSSIRLGIDSKLTSWATPSLGSPESVFLGTATTICFTDEAVSDDAGFAVDSSYQTGFSDLGAPSVKTVRQLQAWGSGVPTLSVGVDYAAPDTGSAVTLGTAPAVDDAIQATSRRGTTFSVKVAAASGAWKIDNVALHVRRPRSPGAKP